jgi:hypothetical protein
MAAVVTVLVPLQQKEGVVRWEGGAFACVCIIKDLEGSDIFGDMRMHSASSRIWKEAIYLGTSAYMCIIKDLEGSDIFGDI